MEAAESLSILVHHMLSGDRRGRCYSSLVGCRRCVLCEKPAVTQCEMPEMRARLERQRSRPGSGHRSRNENTRYTKFDLWPVSASWQMWCMHQEAGALSVFEQ